MITQRKKKRRRLVFTPKYRYHHWLFTCLQSLTISFKIPHKDETPPLKLGPDFLTYSYTHAHTHTRAGGCTDERRFRRTALASIARIELCNTAKNFSVSSARTHCRHNPRHIDYKLPRLRFTQTPQAGVRTYCTQAVTTSNTFPQTRRHALIQTWAFTSNTPRIARQSQ